MSSITLKNIPPTLHEAFKKRAKKNARSMQAEILSVMAEEVGDYVGEPEMSLNELSGCLKSDRKSVTIEEMDQAIQQKVRESWEQSL